MALALIGLSLVTVVSARTHFATKEKGLHVVHIGDLEDSPTAPATELPDHDIDLVTGSAAVAHVKFENGMSWEVGEGAELSLDFFQYAGREMQLSPMQVTSQIAYQKIRAIDLPREESVSTLRGALTCGEFAITCARLQPASNYEIHTREAVINLRVVAAKLSRSEDNGTRLQVFGGYAEMKMASGNVEVLRAGDQVTISPSGQISRLRIGSELVVSYPISEEVLGSLLGLAPGENVGPIVVTQGTRLDADTVSVSL
ncbi:hypothetical protein [Oleiharenicola lentus]|uniref:hypothetical protein n=1 Tax=Oleiharenicola lentus TaxID=2508720 RepID=UPI003F67D253